jgi:hypothetical protein
MRCRELSVVLAHGLEDGVCQDGVVCWWYFVLTDTSGNRLVCLRLLGFWEASSSDDAWRQELQPSSYLRLRSSEGACR